MSVSTVGIVNKSLRFEDIYKFVKEHFDANAQLKAIPEIDFARITFTYEGEFRKLDCSKGTKSEDSESYPFLTDDCYMSLSLNYWGASVELITSILKQFSGWIDEDDCDDVGFYYVERVG